MSPRARPLAERWREKVDMSDPDGCWPWTGYRTSHGYGQIAEGGRFGAVLRAHRVAYELVRGPIPVGLVIDHLCCRPECQNPWHMEAVPQRVNAERGGGLVAATRQRLERTACKNGHPWSEYGYHNGKQRVCRECGRIRQAKWRSVA